MACYKRAALAKRNVDLWLGVPGVDRVVVLIQPMDAPYPAPADAEGPEVWVQADQMFPSVARNTAVRFTEENFHPKLVLVTDDDVMPIIETVVEPLVELALKPDTGTVAITRKSGTAAVADEDVLEPLPYIGGGYLIEPKKFLAVGGFPNDMGDEKGFGLALYLAGYRNYRSRRSLAIHEQNRAGNGGYRELVRQAAAGEKVDIPDWDSNFGRNHPFLRTELSPLAYGGVKAPGWTTGARYTLTEAAKRQHEANHLRLMRLCGSSGLTDDELRGFVRAHQWVFASTMRWAPHWYVTRAAALSELWFDRFEQAIFERGVDRAWGKRVYRYLELDGWEYWAMDISDAGGRIINRAKVKER